MNNRISHLPTSNLSKDFTNRHFESKRGTTLLHNGDVIFRMGDHLDGVYLVNAGAVKIFRTTEHGDQQILGFYMPGELFGLDALTDGVSRTTAVALDTSNISLIPYSTIYSSENKFEKIDLIHQIGETLIRDNDLIMMLSQRTAERRLAWFLVEFSDRLVERGIRPDEFTLPMTRTDISVFLGLAVETVCRELARFCDAGLVKKNRRRLILLDIDAIRRVANGDDLDSLKINSLSMITAQHNGFTQAAGSFQ